MNVWAVTVALLGALSFVPGDAGAQSAAEIHVSLEDERIEGVDRRLMDKVWKDDPNASVEDINQLLVRAFEYYKRQNFYAAYRLFSRGTSAYGDRKDDENFKRAKYYGALSLKGFCEKESALCRALHSTKDNPELEAAYRVYAGLMSAAFAPPGDIRDQVVRECHAAFARFKSLFDAALPSPNGYRFFEPMPCGPAK